MSVRHVVHDNDRCRLVVEVDVGWVVLTLFFGNATTPVGTAGGFSSHASVHLSPADARDRAMLSRAVTSMETLAYPRVGQTNIEVAAAIFSERRVHLDALHRSVMDITRRPTA
jgi:hypothetical protein